MGTVHDRAPGAITVDEAGTDRVWRAGKLPAMPIRKLPEAPEAVHIIGPAMILVALGVGFGETYLWPRLVIVFGPNIRWLFLVGVLVQTVVMLEMARYAMATGESIFFGAARVFQPIMWLFFVTAIAVYIWPGHLSTGADAFEELTGIPWQLSACIGLVIIGLMFTVVKIVYNIVEAVLTFLVGVLVIGSAIVAAIVGSLSDLGDVLLGLVRFDFGIPHAAVTAAWFPIIVGSIAFAGPSGMQQMWYTLWLRDKGAGMGTYIPRIKGLTHMDEEESMPSRGYMFDTEDPENMQRWKGWRRWVHFDAWVLFWGITMLTTIIYTVLAQSALQIDPGIKAAILADDQGAVLNGMSAAFAQAGGAIIGGLFFVFIAVIGWKMSFGIFDAF